MRVYENGMSHYTVHITITRLSTKNDDGPILYTSILGPKLKTWNGNMLAYKKGRPDPIHVKPRAKPEYRKTKHTWGWSVSNLCGLCSKGRISRFPNRRYLTPYRGSRALSEVRVELFRCVLAVQPLRAHSPTRLPKRLSYSGYSDRCGVCEKNYIVFWFFSEIKSCIYEQTIKKWVYKHIMIKASIDKS